MLGSYSYGFSGPPRLCMVSELHVLRVIREYIKKSQYFIYIN